MMRPSFWLQQARARRASALGIMIFVLIYALTLALTALLMLLIWHLKTGLPYRDSLHSLTAWSLWASMIFVVLSPILAQAWSVRDGLDGLMRQLAARPLEAMKATPALQCLLDVCAEMSIASGQRITALYVMEHEEGINAFVLAQQPHQPVLVITAGAVQHLERSALQALVAHEFSHLEAGDATLNLRLWVALSGLHAIDHMGRLLQGWGGAAREDSLILATFSSLLGGALRAVGASSVYLGRMVRSAIGRQREYLADARAVQWTRQGDAVVDLLMQVSEHSTQGRWRHPRAEEFSHMCLVANGEEGGWWASHPPLAARIKAVDGEAAMAHWRARHQKKVAAVVPTPTPTSPPIPSVDGSIDFDPSCHLAQIAPAQRQMALLTLAGVVPGTPCATRMEELPSCLEQLLPVLASLSAAQRQSLRTALPTSVSALITLLQIQAHELVAAPRMSLQSLQTPVSLVLRGGLHWIAHDEGQEHALLIQRTLLGLDLPLPEAPGLIPFYQALLQVRALEPFALRALWQACQDIILVAGPCRHDELLWMSTLAQLWGQDELSWRHSLESQAKTAALLP